jgi:hypothetical protein
MRCVDAFAAAFRSRLAGVHGRLHGEHRVGELEQCGRGT